MRIKQSKKSCVKISFIDNIQKLYILFILYYLNYISNFVNLYIRTFLFYYNIQKISEMAHALRYFKTLNRAQRSSSQNSTLRIIAE